MAQRSLPNPRPACMGTIMGRHYKPAFFINISVAVLPNPQLLEWLWDIGLSISAGELSNLITKGHDPFHSEKNEILSTGLRCSSCIQTDDTGARHQGQNSYCTVICNICNICNESFAWYATTGSKSRKNFVSLLHRPVIEEELLLILKDPSLPLHNNLSERLIREYVKRRKISGGTRSEAGRQCRDTFVSLMKTCRLYGLPFWDYLTDRLNSTGLFPRLGGIIETASFLLPCGLPKVTA